MSEHGEPPEGLMCLVTMEDITKDDGNYGKCTVGCCVRLMEAFIVGFSHINCVLSLDSVEFQGYPSMKWKAAMFEQSVVQQLLDTQFHDFVTRVKTTDCQAELRRLLGAGPPIWISDNHGFPLEEGDTHVVNLWYASDNQERSAKLDGALEGEERQVLWDELKQFIIVEGKEEGDDDDKEADKS